MKYKVAALTLVFTLISLIVFADSGHATPAIDFMMTVPHGDKITHFLLLGLLSYFINSALSCRFITIFKQNFMIGSIIIAFLISGEEFSQAFIPHRNFELLDLFANYAGIYTFGILARIRQINSTKVSTF